MTIAIDLISYLALGLAFLMLVATIYSLRRNRHLKNKLVFIREQVDRAGRLLYSEKQEEILAGIEILRIFRLVDERVKVLPRVMELSHSDNPVIAQNAGLLKSEILLSISSTVSTERNMNSPTSQEAVSSFVK